MSHDTEFMQRRLPVKQHNVTINHVSLNHVTVLQLLSHLLSVTVLQEPEANSHNIQTMNKRRRKSAWKNEKLSLRSFKECMNNESGR